MLYDEDTWEVEQNGSSAVRAVTCGGCFRIV